MNRCSGERSEWSGASVCVCGSVRRRGNALCSVSRARRGSGRAGGRHVTLLSSSTCPPSHSTLTTQHSPLTALYRSTALCPLLLFLLFYSPLLPAILPSCHLPEPRAPVTDTRLSAYPSYLLPSSPLSALPSPLLQGGGSIKYAILPIL